MGRIYCFGSLNIDHVYRVSHFVRPGETLAAGDCEVNAGGKGANQSVAAARAGALVKHIGKIGRNGGFLIQKLHQAGVGVTGVICDESALTGQAMIQVVPSGENAIVVSAGANFTIAEAELERGLSGAEAGDILLLQNETALTDVCIRAAKRKGMTVAFNFAPYVPEMVPALPLELVDYLLLNETEASGLSGERDLSAILATLAARYPAATLVVTLGKAGAVLQAPGALAVFADSPAVIAVDATAAGDTFVGYFLAGVLAGETGGALRRACRAAALAVTRPGAIDSIPTAAEVDAFSL